MRKRSFLSIALLSVCSLAAAEDFDGSKPMVCAPLHGHDCLPDGNTCTILKPEAGRDVNIYIDVAQKTAKTPYRNDKLPILSVGNNTKSLILQGTSLEFVWNATIHRTTGRLTVTIADREGAYIVFGQCKLGEAKPAAKK